MATFKSRREFIRDLGLGAAALPFILNLPSLAFANQQARKQRLVVLFSPNGVVPDAFWPTEEGSSFAFKDILSPLEPFKADTLVVHGVCDKVRGDGDNHMRGIGCLLTGTELYPALGLGSVLLQGDAATVMNDPRVVSSYLGGDLATISRSGTSTLPKRQATAGRSAP